MNGSDLFGLAGDVFNLDGKVAGSIPPSGRPDAISFRISRVVSGSSLFPAWADMMVNGGIPVRINSDICKPPYVRLFFCVGMVGQKIDELLALEPEHNVGANFDGQQFVFWVESLQSPFRKLDLIIVDTMERVLKWNPQYLRVGDGQHRHGGSKRRK